MKILKNKIRCRKCNDIIESRTRHDYQVCECGLVSVDGGKEYFRRGFTNSPEEDYEELSITVEHLNIDASLKENGND